MVMGEMAIAASRSGSTAGNTIALAEEVAAGTPAALPALPAGAAANRLTLARWLVSGNHPLTARVMVNRLWQMLFGVGIVKTSEDFGIAGAMAHCIPSFLTGSLVSLWTAAGT